ncbi:hypothetical protein ACJMK2_010051 [Sinanodonta woodiana]|uniref:Uncharacterized protein n=1 Tax=Sinanodonta woodiana TaxID=1069815 RepID=A0ABD3VE51_SINWO
MLLRVYYYPPTDVSESVLKAFKRRWGECIIRLQQTLWRVYYQASIDVVKSVKMSADVVESVLSYFNRRCGETILRLQQTLLRVYYKTSTDVVESVL